MTCPSADRLCPIPDEDAPPRPLEASSSELPPSRPGLKVGRLLCPTCRFTQRKTHAISKTILRMQFTLIENKTVDLLVTKTHMKM